MGRLWDDSVLEYVADSCGLDFVKQAEQLLADDEYAGEMPSFRDLIGGYIYAKESGADYTDLVDRCMKGEVITLPVAVPEIPEDSDKQDIPDIAGDLDTSADGETGYRPDEMSEDDLKALFALPEGVTGSLDEVTMRNVWESVKLASDRSIEVLVPATLTIDGALERAIKNINRKRDNINIRRFDENNLITILDRNDSGVERIIISDENTNRFIWSLAVEKGKAQSFRGVRVLNVRMPSEYANPSQCIAYQSKMLTIAILGRILSTGEDATPSVEAVLRDLLEENTDLTDRKLDRFIQLLGAPASADKDVSTIVNRISYFLSENKAVRLIRTLEKQWLITREFWTCA